MNFKAPAARVLAMLLGAQLLCACSAQVPRVRWYTGELGADCDATCAAQEGATLTCQQGRMQAVTTANMISPITAIQTEQGAEAVGTCSEYWSSPSGATTVAPDFQPGSGNTESGSSGCHGSGVSSTCSGAVFWAVRLCCCTASGEDAAAKCPLVSTDCSTGTWWDTTTKSCIDTATGCPVGYWKDATKCVQCIESGSSSSSGSTSVSDCFCIAGYWGEGGGACTACAVAKFGPESSKTTEELACTGTSAACAVGRYGNSLTSTGMAACAECPFNLRASTPIGSASCVWPSLRWYLGVTYLTIPFRRGTPSTSWLCWRSGTSVLSTVAAKCAAAGTGVVYVSASTTGTANVCGLPNVATATLADNVQARLSVIVCATSSDASATALARSISEAKGGSSCNTICQNRVGIETGWNPCHVDRMKAVNSATKMASVFAAIVADQYGGVAPDSLNCPEGYTGSTSSHAPYKHDRVETGAGSSASQKCYYSSTVSATCAAISGEPANANLRLCCCAIFGEDLASVCPVEEADCGAGTHWSTASSSCLPCEAGRFKRNRGAESCEKCAEGKYQPSADTSRGNTNEIHCSGSCALGKYSDATGLTNMNLCKNCAQGSVAGRLGAVVCTPCEVGMVPDASKAVCVRCDLGKYRDRDTMSCMDCAVGMASVDMMTFKKMSGEDSKVDMDKVGLDDDKCPYCDPGRFTSSPGATACDDCIPGKYLSYGYPKNPGVKILELPVPTECMVCDDGKISTRNQATECKACGDGTVPDGSNAACVSCAAGKFRDTNLIECQNCANGTASAALVDSACSTCAEGRFTSGEGLTSCADCLPGMYLEALTPPTTTVVCKTCGIGKITSSNALTVCADCDPGQVTSGAGKSTCSDCIPGKFLAYTDLFAAIACKECSTLPGSVSTGNKATECTACSDGTVPDGSKAACVLVLLASFATRT